jgi:hypothetical protein
MSNFHIIGSGGCGFLRANYLLRNHIPIKYKGGGPKYQNSFETWNEENGLIWDAESLSKQERVRRVSFHFDYDRDGWIVPNITHSYLKYVPEFLEFYPDMKFFCLRGRREHSIKSLAISWGYRNPCYVKDRSIGFGHNRYAVSQFPDYSDSRDEFHATERYWDEYYKIANDLQEKYPNNFLIADASEFFGNTEYQLCCLGWIGIDVSIDSTPKAVSMPVNFNDWTISTTLHGGLGNNLFQMAEVISFCKKFNLPEPKFGTWDLWNGGKLYPSSYNSDRLLGGHDGSHGDMRKYFPNLNWQRNLSATFDTKFVINDMFRFGSVENLDDVRNVLSINKDSVPGTVSLHLRFCTRPADDHVNGYVDDQFYVKVFEKIPSKSKVYIFADDNNKARHKLAWFREKFDMHFEIFDGDAFQSLRKMVECEYHILHVSTFSFWSAFLDPNQPNSKVFYPESFIGTHSPNMIPYKEWQML